MLGLGGKTADEREREVVFLQRNWQSFTFYRKNYFATPPHVFLTL
jgi:hypothetical protein